MRVIGRCWWPKTCPCAAGQRLPDLDQKGRHPRPSGLFEPEGDWIAAVVEEPIEGADAVTIAVEPEGDSPRPTTEPVLLGEGKA